MVEDHFLKHYYRSNRVDWNFNILFDDQPSVGQMAECYKSSISHPGLYPPIPARWLHATILRVGLLEDFSEAEMLAVTDILKVSLARLELPVFTFESWWIWDGSPVLHISPGNQFMKIYDHVVAALQQTIGKDRTNRPSYGDFIPHMSLAYTRAQDAEGEIYDQLAAHPIAPASFQVSNLALIKQWPTGDHYEWEVIRRIPVGKPLLSNFFYDNKPPEVSLAHD
jgi:2'-5' RNA ligase